MLVALQGVTGVPVSVSEKDREFIPIGVTSSVVSAKDENTAQQGTPKNESALTGTIDLSTVPTGADVYIDGAFVGNSPASLKLAPGKHTIRVEMAGYKDWTRDVTVEAGSHVTLTGTLLRTGV